MNLPSPLPIRAPRPLERCLTELAGEGRWTFPDALQGARSDLSVAVGLLDGALTAVAQWTSPEDACVRCICASQTPDGIARVLTLAAVAVQGRQA